jgi:hypothetical protein
MKRNTFVMLGFWRQKESSLHDDLILNCRNLFLQIQQLSPIVPQRRNQIKSATHPNKQVVGPLT